MAGEYSYSSICAGTADFIRTAAIPLGEMLEGALGREGVSKNDLPDSGRLGFDPRPQNALFTPEVVGVLFFLGSRAATKFLDEIYANTLQPHIKRWLAHADSQVQHKRDPSFSVSLWYEDLDLVVVTVLQGRSYADLAKASERVAEAHRNAVGGVLARGTRGGVVLVVIDLESTHTVADSFESVAEALRSLEA